MSCKMSAELSANRDLLDPDFNGYKISLESFATSECPLPIEVNNVAPAGYYSYLHVRLFGLHNHLISDKWYNENSVYYVCNDWCVMKVEATNPKISQVWKIPDNPLRNNGSYNISVSFPNDSIAVLTDGAGVLYILHTGERDLPALEENWTAQEQTEILGNGKQFKICDSRMRGDELHCLLMRIEEKDTNDPHSAEPYGTKSRFNAIYYWVIFHKEEQSEWIKKQIRRIVTDGEVNYSYFSSDVSGLFLASSQHLQFPDNDNKQDDKNVHDELMEESPNYYWHQSPDHITLRFPVSSDISSGDINVVADSDKDIHVEVSGAPLLSGETFCRIKPEELTYHLNSKENSLKVKIRKFESGKMWDFVVIGDERGKEIMDPDRRKSFDILSNMAPEFKERVDCSTAPTFNPQQLEECDYMTYEHARIYFVDGETMTVKNEVNLCGDNIIFDISVKPELCPYFCTRHDVDGLLYELLDPTTETDFCVHRATLNAYGYLHASKQAKFATCATDMSYSLISSVDHTMTLYRLENPPGVLCNRKTGKCSSKVGVVYLVNKSDEIMGVYATKRLFAFYAYSKEVF